MVSLKRSVMRLLLWRCLLKRSTRERGDVRCEGLPIRAVGHVGYVDQFSSSPEGFEVQTVGLDLRLLKSDTLM